MQSSKAQGKLDWQNTAACIFCLITAGGAIYFTGKYLIGIALPFLFAWLVSACAAAIGEKVAARRNISRKFCVSVAVLLILMLIFFITALAANRLIYELTRLVSHLGSEQTAVEDMIRSVLQAFDSFGSRFTLVRRLREMDELTVFFDKLDGMLGETAASVISKISSAIPGFAASVIGALPSILLTFAVAVISSFYFALDRERISKRIIGIMPKNMQNKIPELRKRAGKAATGYLKAYLIILFITFCELFIGLSVLKIDYAFLIAAVIAVVDILPILGVGTVLVPWAAISLIGKNWRIGFGLLILYGIVVIIRQFIEPRIVGGSLGIHPLVTLLAMYIGFKLFGIAGMIIGPILALIGRSLASSFFPGDTASVNS